MTHLRSFAWTLVVVAAVGAGCTSPPVDRTPVAQSEWVDLPPSPLSARRAPIGVWTGQGFLVVGGHRWDLCPPGPTADCAGPGDGEFFRDGARFNPRTREWRSVSAAPVPIRATATAVVGQTVFFRQLVGAELLRYHLVDDRWDRIPIPGSPTLDAGIVAFDTKLLVYPFEHGQSRDPDRLLDPGTGEWTTLPGIPMSPGMVRSFVTVGRRLVYLDTERVANPGVKPTRQRTALLGTNAGGWQVFPTADVLAGSGLVVDRDTIVRPVPGGFDGGQVNGWGRTYPSGGVLNLKTGSWGPLPSGLSERDFVLGVYGEGGMSEAWSDRGLLLNAAKGRWLRVPDPPNAFQEAAVVAGGRWLVRIGGAVPDGGRARLRSGGEILDVATIVDG